MANKILRLLLPTHWLAHSASHSHRGTTVEQELEKVLKQKKGSKDKSLWTQDKSPPKVPMKMLITSAAWHFIWALHISLIAGFPVDDRVWAGRVVHPRTRALCYGFSRLDTILYSLIQFSETAAAEAQSTSSMCRSSAVSHPDKWKRARRITGINTRWIRKE